MSLNPLLAIYHESQSALDARRASTQSPSSSDVRVAEVFANHHTPPIQSEGWTKNFVKGLMRTCLHWCPSTFVPNLLDKSIQNMPLTQLIDATFLKEAIDNCLAPDLYYLLIICIQNDNLAALLDEDIAIKFLEHWKDPNLALKLLEVCLNLNAPDDFTKTLLEECFTLYKYNPSFLKALINHRIFIRYADKQCLAKLIQTLPDKLFLDTLLPKCLITSPELASLMDRNLLAACMNRFQSLCQDPLPLPGTDSLSKKEYLIDDFLQPRKDTILVFYIDNKIIYPFELLAETIISNDDTTKQLFTKINRLLSSSDIGSSDGPCWHMSSMQGLGNNYLKNFLETAWPMLKQVYKDCNPPFTKDELIEAIKQEFIRYIDSTSNAPRMQFVD